LRIVALQLRGICKAWTCAIALLCLAVPGILAQRYSFRDYTEGLGNLAVSCLAQDRTGYLWVGTENGLYRYDGNQFRRFGAPEGLPARVIQNLFLGTDGTLWVGTTTGIYFERQDGNFAEVQPPASTGQFEQRLGTAFTAMGPDRVVTTGRGGAYLLRKTGPERWAAEAMHLEGGAIWSVLYTPDGALWYGCDSDLCRLAGGKTTHMRAALGLPEDQWLHLLWSRDGHIWLRGATHLGAVLPAERRFESHDLPGRGNAVAYVALTEDAQGRILASQGPAFGLWEDGRWRMVTAHSGLSRNDLSALFVDREGSVWIGVVGHGLKRWVGEDRWETYTAGDGLSDDIVWASQRDRSGRLWIGTESGVDWIPAGGGAPKSWQAPGIQTARANSLAEAADGSIWMGSAAGNVVRIDPKTLAGKQWKVAEVYRMVADGARRLWLATGGGLYVVNIDAADRTPRLVEDAAIATPRQRFTDLSLDPANRLWAASEHGLFRFDGNGWRRIDPGLSGVNPSQIAADKQGNLWAAGTFSGIMRLRIVGDKVVESEHIARPHLLSEEVVSLAVDHRGWLWAGQDAGLTVYDGHTWRSFTQDDGLSWNDTDGYALSEDKDGSMWIGTSGGLSHLMEPRAIPAGPPLPAVFSQVTFGAQVIGNGASLRWSASPLTISMASLSFRDARHIRIRYRLLGLESEWVETEEKSVRYPRLTPGSYRFQAVAVDATSGAVSPMEEIAFRIAPRWWQSRILQLALGVLGVLAVVLLWRWRWRLLEGQKRELEAAVYHRTQDLVQEKGELLRARERMRHYAEHDDLTGLWNHRIIIQRLRQEVSRASREGTPLSVILVDLDHFKLVNDNFGHPAGDQVLREVGAIFQRAVRAYDWVGRYGGEEFLLIMPGSGLANACRRAEQFRLAVQTALIAQGDTAIRVTASFGVACSYASDCETLIQTADTALYQAKANGRNCVVATEIGAPQDAAAPQQ
jgi:diguanylate cyclase (GGDEF)-like protein